jgi:hypothetical protein
VGVALVAAVSAALFFRGSLTRAGDVRTVDITLVAADKDSLSCAFGRSVQGFSCEFEAPQQAVPVAPSEKNRLSPYMTTDRTLYLGAGLFAQPEVLARVSSDLAKPPKERQRFVARCQVKLVERVETFQTRWTPRGRWGQSGPAWVIEPLECTVR